MPIHQLEQLRKMTTIVADSGDFDSVRTFAPSGATTNPSLVLQAAQKPEYHFLIEKAIIESRRGETPQHKESLLIDTLFVLFGIELLKIVPGRVSTEVDASLSFDTKKSIERAVQLISLYERYGIPRDRVLIKLAATPEGVRAAEMLEMVGIHCNMTLVFSLIQAAACAEVNATLVSPFVGRVLDWHRIHHPHASYTAEEDPGVSLVRSIYRYFKAFGLKTAVMGASFRNKDEVLALAGCDLLTISPKLLDELSHSLDLVPQKLMATAEPPEDLRKLPTHEPMFRFLLNEDQMASEKLSEGIRGFCEASRTLVKFISSEFGWSAS
jgi:transaldolase